MNMDNEISLEDLSFLQLSDSFFPTGLYTTSNGLEALFYEGKLKKPKHLQAKVTVVEGDLVQKTSLKETGEFTPEQIAKLKAMTKNKGGRPKKEVTEEN